MKDIGGDCDNAFSAVLLTLTNGQISVHLNNFTDSPYTVKRGTQVAIFTDLTPEQIKRVKPIDPVTTWHLLQENKENAAYYASSLIKSTKPEGLKEHYWLPTPEDPGDPQHHTPIQKRILSELISLQKIEKLNPQDDPESRRQFLTNFDWTDFMLQPAAKSRIEDHFVEFHNIFARCRFDIDMNEDFKIKLTPKDDSRPIVRVCHESKTS